MEGDVESKASKTNVFLRFYNFLTDNVIRFCSVVFRGPVLFNPPLTFFLPEQFDIWGRRIWPCVLEPDNTYYEALTRDFLKIVDDEKHEVKETHQDHEDESESMFRCVLTNKKNSVANKGIITLAKNKEEPNKSIVTTEELLKIYPEWTKETLDFIKLVFISYADSTTGLLSKNRFSSVLTSFGDSASRIHVMTQYSMLEMKQSKKKGIDLKGLCDYLYNSSSVFEKPNTMFKTDKFYLRERTADLANLSNSLEAMHTETSIHLGYC